MRFAVRSTHSGDRPNGHICEQGLLKFYLKMIPEFKSPSRIATVETDIQ